ncbi:MAG TPA: patatin-like phospholipase family protein, partial [Pyrinomonadaceae bacterium]
MEVVEEPVPVRQASALLQCLRPRDLGGIGEGRAAFLVHLAGRLGGDGRAALFAGRETMLALPGMRAAELEGLDPAAAEDLVGKLFADFKRLITELKELPRPRFGYVRRLLTRLLKLRMPAPAGGGAPPKFWRRHVWMTQQLALSTYKDPDLPVDERLARALEVIRTLHDEAGQGAGERQETYALTGAVYKRLWEYDGQKQNLERSLDFYLRGYAIGLPEGAGTDDVLAHLDGHPATARVSTREDNGYTGINAAFVLDRLAYLEKREAGGAGARAASGGRNGKAAELIRGEIVRTLGHFEREQPGYNEGEWWFHATVAEALFGLGDYDGAVERLERGRSSVKRLKGRDVPSWEFESTARQLATLAYLRSGAGSAKELEGKPEWVALERFLKSDAPVRSAFMGKVGLALSGGGFRASFYHIGVLARLAEVGLLPHVEVLSCVSGGSIVGAHYYLKLRKLLEEKRDAADRAEGAGGGGEFVTPGDYVKLVRELAEEFLDGVKRNVRMRVLADLPSNLKVLLFPGYSRTLRVGELYERELYSKVGDGRRDGDGNPVEPYFTGSIHEPDWWARLRGRRRNPRYLADLRVMPLDKGGARQTDFNPRLDNLWRRNKVPVLLINAASLNTGHTWQFTTDWMGEPPAGIVSKVDGNERLRRMYFREAPLRFDGRAEGFQAKLYRRLYYASHRVKSALPFAAREGAERRRWRLVRLGHAVAASSCVPGLFEPLAMEELFPGRVVRLVDGGVCDNQGVAGLLEQECTVLLVSDGSGQTASQEDPSQGRLGVLWRSDNILQARVREAQYRELAARRRASLLRGLMFVHLKQELEVTPQDWLYCAEPHEPADDEPPFARAGAATHPPAETGYGFDRGLQMKLAAVRTDLDSFNDVEAYALMLSGYRMTERYLRESLPEFDGPRHAGWPFDAVEEGVGSGGREAQEFTRRVVEVGGNMAFKVWRLKWWLKAA